MKSALYPAERNAALGIAFAASCIAVLPTPSRLCAVTLLAAAPAVAWMTSSPTAWLGWFLGAVLLLPPLPASISDTGAHPAVAAAAVGFYAALLFARHWTFAKSPILTATAALALLMTASVSMALIYSGVAVAAGSAVRALLFALGPFLFLYIVCGPGQSFAGLGSRPARLLFAAGVLSAVFACIDFFYQFPAPAGYSPQFIWLADRVLRRAQGMFYDAGALGNMCAFFLVMATAAIIAPGRVVNRWIAALGALPLGAALVFSYSRAAVLNLVVAVSAMLWLRRREVKWLRTALATAVAIVVAALVLGSLAPGFAMLWLDRARKTVDLALSANDAALSGRVLSWQTIASFIADHPVRTLLGVGY